MKNIYIISLLLFFAISTNNALAQNQKFYDLLHKTIHLNDVFSSDKYYEKGFVFSVNMSVNSKGTIDSVIFSHYRDNDELGKLVNFNKIRNDLTNNKIKLKEYKNKTLVLIVMIIRGDNAMITLTNGNQLMDNWKKIIACSIELSNKRLIYLTPVLFSSLGKGNIF